MIRVFVTGAGALLGQGIVRSLRRAKGPFRIATADPSPLSSALFWGDQGYVIERADSAAFLGRLREVLAQERPHLVLIGTDVELPILARERAALEAEFGLHVLVSSPEVVAIADDKYLTAEFLERMGFSPPASALPEDSEALERLMDETGFPLVVKPRIGARSIGVSVARSRTELRAALEGRQGLVVQEHVGDPDREFTAGVLVFDGAAQAAVVMRRDLRDGNTYRAYVEPDPALADTVRRMGEALGPRGPANFQFRLDDEGAPRVFEINARFSGTTPLRALAGFNEVEMCALRLIEGAPITQPEIQPMTILRHWSEQVVSTADLERLR